VRTLERSLAIGLLLTVAGAIYFAVRDVPLPEAFRIHRLVTDGEPRQEASDRAPFATTIKGYTYTLTPRARYDITGLVVSQHRGDALFNLYHQADPGNIRDVCVVWGESIVNGSYRKVQFWSGEFTCSFAWSSAISPPFKPETASNNHLLPADAAIARQIGAIQVGDQIRMAGLLVDYKVTRDGREIFTRHTSLTRGDTGNGACEILYVTALTLVAPGDHLRASAARYCGYASVALLVGVVALWLARPPRAE
jgi:hypothetical protein